MSTRREIEEREKAKKAKLNLVNKGNKRVINIHTNNEPFIENMEINSDMLNELISSGLYNVKYSTTDDVTNLHLINIAI